MKKRKFFITEKDKKDLASRKKYYRDHIEYFKARGKARWEKIKAERMGAVL